MIKKDSAFLDHSKCGMSWGICEHETFGQGKLDGNGYWEFPCEVCARGHERLDDKPLNAYWPKEEPREDVPDNADD